LLRQDSPTSIQVVLTDYRAVSTPKVPYDKVVSIEMLEAVGQEYLHTYFACVDKLLKKDGGIAMFQCITMPESRHESYANGEDFNRKYIFPGRYLPSISQLVETIKSGSERTLILERMENIGGHYAKTLRLWKQNFLQNFDSWIRPALMTEHEHMGEKEAEVFRRKWEVSTH
jgi:cyclopropane-fatty-acyl-phospholipid synthase